MNVARILVTGGSVLLGASALCAQATVAAPVPCRDTPCSLVVDWGVGKGVSDMPPDRRYGSASEFEGSVREALRAHEMTAVASAAGATVAIRIQATYKTRVLCDDMPGTMPDRSCATIGEAIATFGTSTSESKLPATARMINRCGASERVMTMKQFGGYVGEMIWFSLEGNQKKASKPSGKC